MKNPIEKQDAIDAVMQYCPDDDGSCSKANRDIRELLDDIENLPSAQLEPRWIPCDKGIFPKEGKEVLVTDGENMMVAYYRNDAEAWDNYNFGWVEGRNEEIPYGINKVIAWMPLPGPYRAERSTE